MPLLSTENQLALILPQAKRAAVRAFLQPLIGAMAAYGIDTPERQAAFLAQIGHESGQFNYVRELGGNAYLAKYDTGTLATRLGNTPAADGDGQRYCGRGLIQITGRRNYELCGLALELDLLGQPQLLEQPAYAALSAAWFWQNAGLNELADKGAFDAITRRINGGQNGREDRRAIWAKASQVLKG
ncbi:glycoside hydrolase family 19 protein [Pseudogulbenkiania ferrooxidans]|uniref:Glycoside hydrolase family 19 n=1 Tax=Pseudogulbenkiania ferrooxidans 2002 TaxID=279714 RepID=B9YYW2_9NEIS|nr:glycoside hydrolase family 19 protein [Pseudogulbenkiania ferrooxidans]EEG10315.1 glycoside hydrolase family 19 [Pseudogulbenkiania ferrooxidans 2002]